ncbi:hypothetical protein E4U54_007623 [Claviceps lovelessii]|nr:hypothetical protein E4U54_007623 [Claviceps lovelessii]
MHPAVYAVLLTCLYGSSFGAPIDLPTNQVTGLLNGVTERLPIDSVTNSPVGHEVASVVPSLAKKDLTGGVAGLTSSIRDSSSVGNLIGGFPIIGGHKRGLADYIPKVGETGDITEKNPADTTVDIFENLPGVGDKKTRDLDGLPVAGNTGGLTKGLPVGNTGGDLTKSLPVGPADNLINGLPILGGHKRGFADYIPKVGETGDFTEKNPVDTTEHLFEEISGVGHKETRDLESLPVVGNAGSLTKSLPIDDLSKDVPVVGGKHIRDLEDLPLVGNAGDLTKSLPVSSVDDLSKDASVFGRAPLPMGADVAADVDVDIELKERDMIDPHTFPAEKLPVVGPVEF